MASANASVVKFSSASCADAFEQVYSRPRREPCVERDGSGIVTSLTAGQGWIARLYMNRCAALRVHGFVRPGQGRLVRSTVLVVTQEDAI